MKRFLNVVLAIMMVMSLGTAFATDSMTGNDIPTSIAPVTTEVEAPGITIVIVDDNQMTKDLKETDPETIMAELPETVKTALGEEYNVINEIVTIQTFGAENFEVIPAVLAKFVFTTPYEAGTELKLVVVTDEKEYTVIDGVVNEEGVVEATFDAEWVEKVIVPSAMIVVNK